MQLLYFAYGSNMNFSQMNVRCPGAIFLGRARFKNSKYYINSNGYAGVEKSLDNEVLGCLWELTKENWQELDRYEAVDQGYYRKKEIYILDETDGVSKKVITYFSNELDYGIPTTHYHDGVIEGAKQVGLPEDYINFLESWRNGSP